MRRGGVYYNCAGMYTRGIGKFRLGFMLVVLYGSSLLSAAVCGLNYFYFELAIPEETRSNNEKNDDECG